MGKIKKIKKERKRAEVEDQLRRMKRNRMTVGVLFVSILFLVLSGLSFLGFKSIDKKYALGNKIKENLRFDQNGSRPKEETKTANKSKTYQKEPAMTIEQNKTYLAKVETTDGTFTIKLNAKDTPKTVNNFVTLSKDGFYDNTIFHRIIKDFMIQGGDPKGDGTGDPGYKFDDEKFTGDYTPGTVAMANSGANTNGSQFFIMTGDYSNGKLPKNYVIFGSVTEGMDVVQKIAATPVEQSSSGENSKPTERVEIKKVTISEE